MIIFEGIMAFAYKELRDVRENIMIKLVSVCNYYISLCSCCCLHLLSFVLCICTSCFFAHGPGLGPAKSWNILSPSLQTPHYLFNKNPVIISTHFSKYVSFKLMDMKVFVDADPDVRLARRSVVA